MTKFLTGAALALLATTSAHAVTIDGTFAAGVGVITSGSLINVGSVLDLTSGIATGIGTGDLSGVSFGTTLSGISDPFTLINGETFAFTLDGFGAFSGTTSLFQLTPGSNVNNRSVRFYALGNFTPTFGGFDAGPGSVTGSFTQTGGADAAVSFSFTFASPPSPIDTPTPAALALFGLGLAGLGLARRAR